MVSRAFVSVRPPSAVTDALAKRLAAWPDLVARRDRWHLTVWFLGEITNERAITSALAAVTGRGGFTARLGGGGTFGAGRKRRTVWVGLVTGGEEMAGIGDAVADALDLDRETLVAHLTLARMAAPVAADIVAALGTEPIGPAWSVGRILLEASSFPIQPVTYRTIAEIPLA